MYALQLLNLPLVMPIFCAFQSRNDFMSFQHIDPFKTRPLCVPKPRKTKVLALLHSHAHAHTLHQTPAKEMPKNPAINSLKPKNPVTNERDASCNRPRETPIVTISEAQI